MGYEKWQQKMNHILREPFHIITTTLLSLLIPLSFLLLARLSTAHYNTSFNPLPPPFNGIFTISIYTTPTLIQSLVAIITIATLVNALTGKIPFLTESSLPENQTTCGTTHLHVVWIIICTLPICVGLGIEGGLKLGIDVTNSLIGENRSLCSRVMFFLGMHETMIYWFNTVVKPVVDGTVFGNFREETWVEKAVMVVSFGGFWWWRLGGEVIESLLVVEVNNKETLSENVGDFVGWWLYYITFIIGIVRIFKGVMWAGMALFCRRCKEVVEDNVDGSYEIENNV